MSAIKAICFDLDGVYFTPQSFKNFVQFLQKQSENPDRVEYFLKKSPEMALFKEGKISEEAYWNSAREKLGLRLTNKEIFRILLECYEVNPEIKTYISHLKKQGYATCVCSNNFVTRIRELEKKFNFYSDFDVRVFSYEERVLKPNKEIFQQLLDRAGVQPQELVYSDDQEEKLRGAQELGIRCFVFQDFAQFKKELEKLGVH